MRFNPVSAITFILAVLTILAGALILLTKAGAAFINSSPSLGCACLIASGFCFAVCYRLTREIDN